MNHQDFLTRTPKMIGQNKMKEYAVLVPIIETDGESSFLFEKRANTLKIQPSEICFPGGKIEPNETPLQASVRETVEELLIEENKIEVIGPSDIFINPFNLMLHPFIARIKGYKGTFNPDEVEQVFTVPLDYFIANPPKRYKNNVAHSLPEDFPYTDIPHGKNYPWRKGAYEVLFYYYKTHIIWGITAHIIESSIHLIQKYRLSEI